MKKTALQWFIEQIENHNGVTKSGFQKCIDEALDMEKEQIKDAYWNGTYDISKKEALETAEHFYNETYKNK